MSRPASSTPTRPTRSTTCSAPRCVTAGADLGARHARPSGLRASRTGWSASATADSPRSGLPDEPHRETLVVDDRGGCGCPSRCAGRPVPRKAYVLRPRVTGSCCRDCGSSTDAPAVESLHRRRPSRGAPAPSRRRGSRACGSHTAREWSLDAYDLDVRPATLTVVRGRSGSGKSTILRVLLGLADPDEGQVLLGGGRPVWAGPDGSRRPAARCRRGVRSGWRVGRAARRRGEPRPGAHRAWPARRPRAVAAHRSTRWGCIRSVAAPCGSCPAASANVLRWRGLSSSAGHWWCSTSRPRSRTRRTPSSSPMSSRPPQPPGLRCCARRTTPFSSAAAGEVITLD